MGGRRGMDAAGDAGGAVGLGGRRGRGRRRAALSAATASSSSAEASSARDCGPDPCPEGPEDPDGPDGSGHAAFAAPSEPSESAATFVAVPTPPSSSLFVLLTTAAASAARKTHRAPSHDTSPLSTSALAPPAPSLAQDPRVPGGRVQGRLKNRRKLGARGIQGVRGGRGARGGRGGRGGGGGLRRSWRDGRAEKTADSHLSRGYGFDLRVKSTSRDYSAPEHTRVRSVKRVTCGMRRVSSSEGRHERVIAIGAFMGSRGTLRLYPTMTLDHRHNQWGQ